ncbi:MAG: DUF6706 family protein [Flavobacteriales bacterium]
MTLKEALQAKAQCPVDDNALEVALIDAALDPAATYTAALLEDVEKALVPLLFSIYTKPDVSEGGFSLNHPDFLRKLKERIVQLATKHSLSDILEQLTDPVPTVTSKPVW